MSKQDDDRFRFRVRPGAPKNRQQKFVSQVLKEVSKAGGKSVRKSEPGPAHALVAGMWPLVLSGHTAQPGSRRVAIKTRLVNLKQAGPRSTTTHLRYIEREGVGRDGEPGQAYGPTTDNADLVAFEERGTDDRHQFRFIVSPEDAEQLDDLRTLHPEPDEPHGGRSGNEPGLGGGEPLEHRQPAHPHRAARQGRLRQGLDHLPRLHRARDARTRRRWRPNGWGRAPSWRSSRACGGRSIRSAGLVWIARCNAKRKVGWSTSINLPTTPDANSSACYLIGRLQRLQHMGLAHESSPGVWTVHADAEQVLRAMGERGDIVRTMQRAMGGVPRDLAVFEPGENARSVVGRVAAKGMADELHDRGYLVVDGTDGKAHYVALNAKVELEQYPVGSVVEARGSAEFRAADKNIAALAVDGLYRTDHHLTMATAQATPTRDPKEVVDAHVRRLEALRRAGIVERVAEGVWRVPTDLPERGRQYDAQRLGGVSVELRSHLPIERQVRVIGATWLDQQLIGGASGIADNGFGGEVREALRQRSDFLVEQGLAERRGQRVILARNLLATLRGREIDTTAKTIAAETGMAYRPLADGERATGVYRRNVQLASGRFAMLDDGMGFSLVPWKPVPR
jgi:hypothetical protein